MTMYNCDIPESKSIAENIFLGLNFSVLFYMRNEAENRVEWYARDAYICRDTAKGN